MSDSWYPWWLMLLYIFLSLYYPHKVQFFPSPRSEYCPVLSRASYGDVMLHTETDDSDPTFVTDLEMTDLLTALSALIILITINLQTLSRLFRSNSILTIRPGLSQSKSKVSKNYKDSDRKDFQVEYLEFPSLLPCPSWEGFSRHQVWTFYIPGDGLHLWLVWRVNVTSTCHQMSSLHNTHPPPHTSNTITTTEYISPSWFSYLLFPVSCVPV